MRVRPAVPTDGTSSYVGQRGQSTRFIALKTDQEAIKAALEQQAGELAYIDFDTAPDWARVPTIWVETDPVWTECQSDDGRVWIAVTKPQLSAVSIGEF